LCSGTRGPLSQPIWRRLLRYPPFSNSLCSVASFTDVDFYGRYNFTDKFSVHASVLNAFNRPPPLDAVTYGGGGGAAYSAALEQAGAVGRYFVVGASYKF
jgi:iron complex outermembrane receptor protein